MCEQNDLTELTTYTAHDRRCYNGACCDDLAKERSHTKNLEKRMKKADPTASCCYFPMEGKFLTFTSPHLEGPPKILTGNFHCNKQEALIEAVMLLEKGFV